MTDERAVAVVINAAREASRRERLQSLINITRRAFRPAPVDRNQRRPGRNRGGIWKKAIFLLRRANSDFYPGPSECSYLQNNGFGKYMGSIGRDWSINRLQGYIYQIYPLLPLEDVGFKFAKCGRDKKIITIPGVSSIQELEVAVGRNMLLIIPNQDLSLANAANVGGLPIGRTEVTTPASVARPETSHGSSNGTNRRVPETSISDYSSDSDFEYQRHQPARPRRTSDSSVHPSEMRDNNSDDDTNNENATLPLQFPHLDDDAVEVVPIELTRNAILEQLLDLYEDSSLIQKSIKVTFKNEMGLDYGGLTKEAFTVFWKQCQEVYFRGENVGVPFLTLTKIRKGFHEHFVVIGRILAHTVLLTRTIPPYFAKSFYLLLGDPDRKIPDDILLGDLLQFVTASERYVLKKAQASFSSLSSRENAMLLDFYQTYGLYENPKENEFSQQLTTIAENTLVRESLDFVKKIRNGIPLFCDSFFRDLTYEQINELLKQQAPTASKILRCLTTTPDDLNNIQSQTIYFFKNYIQNLSHAGLSKLLLFITASEHMPEEITVSLKSFGLPVAHTCSNTLELPIYNTQQELNRQFESILNTDSSFEYSLL